MREFIKDEDGIHCQYTVKHGDKQDSYSCTIESISERAVDFLAEEDEGFKAGPKGGVKPGMTIHIELSELSLPCKVTYVETGRVGANFIDLTPVQKEELK